MMCPPLASPENGQILTENTEHHFGEVIQFQCNFGYVISGSTSLLCMSTGVWNATVPSCICEYFIIELKKIKHFGTKIWVSEHFF